jgi:hypothetical protein
MRGGRGYAGGIRGRGGYWSRYGYGYGIRFFGLYPWLYPFIFSYYPLWYPPIWMPIYVPNQSNTGYVVSDEYRDNDDINNLPQLPSFNFNISNYNKDNVNQNQDEINRKIEDINATITELKHNPTYKIWIDKGYAIVPDFDTNKYKWIKVT